jgi:D-aminopeptidase
VRHRLLGSLIAAALLAGAAAPASSQESARPRARDLGIVPGMLPTGPRNAITDVAGVRVGHATVTAGDSIRTGVTAVVTHGGNAYRSRVPAAIHVGNGFGKLIGITQVNELGELETPVLLTCTLCVWKAADALAGQMLADTALREVRSLNAVVGETNDGFLNDIRARPITAEHVRAALADADTGEVEEGSVGAGTGTIAFGWKGGIGTSSRALPEARGGWTVGVLVQSNFGGDLHIAGVPVGRLLEGQGTQRHDTPDGSIMIVVATDAPLDNRNLERLAERAMLGLARTGGYASNGSGDYVIAFSTHEGVRRAWNAGRHEGSSLANDAMSPLFLAVVEATEEAIYNSLFRATTVRGHLGTAERIPVERVRALLREHRAVR